jgi:hypothetical protein
VDQFDPAFEVPITIGLPKMPKPTAVQFDGVGHEIPSIPLTAVGIDCDCHVYPAFWLTSIEFHPLTKQTAVLGQEAAASWLTPAGGVTAVQSNPPLLVVIRVEPAPGFPVLPTATQSAIDAQEMPVKSISEAGGDSDDQFAPLSDVIATSGVESRLVPTARQTPDD